jgi:hypothetical protein
MLINHNDYEEKNGIFQLKDRVAVPTGMILFTLRNVKTGKITQELVKNMFVTAGKVSLANSFFDSNKGMITYMALGTSAIAPALSDVKLTTELARKAISARSATTNVFTAQTFFTVSEANGTLREAGLFGDIATSTADSGTLFAKAAINRTKSANDTLTASWAITVG